MPIGVGMRSRTLLTQVLTVRCRTDRRTVPPDCGGMSSSSPRIAKKSDRIFR